MQKESSKSVHAYLFCGYAAVSRSDQNEIQRICAHAGLTNKSATSTGFIETDIQLLTSNSTTECCRFRFCIDNDSQPRGYKKIIHKLLDRLNIDSDCKIGECLRLVLVYELIFGKGVKADGDITEFVKQYEAVIAEEWQKLEENSDASIGVSPIAVTLPRYVRVNTLKTSVDDVIGVFQSEGFIFSPEQGATLDENMFCIDTDIPEVLVFSPGTDLHKHHLYKEGKILLQDKASCLPAFLLKPNSKSTVIDACAAPGNKTTHLAAVMKNQGKIFAFDLDMKRLKLLQDQTIKAGAENVDVKHQDFLKTDPQDPKFSKVKYILLDPSCSGSGMVSRMDDLLEDQDDDKKEKLRQRLEALSKFQYAMLCHALSFPNVRKVCYSTCSIHQEENENVVERCLLRVKNKFTLVNLLPSWKHRGLSSFEEGSKCLRASPEEDRTNGFFVALFKRIKNPETHNDENVAHGNVAEMNSEVLCEENQKDNGRQKGTKKRKRGKLVDEQVTEAKIEGANEARELKNTSEKKKKKPYSEKDAKRRRKMMRKPVTAL
eukprot:gene6005-6702_t